MAKTTKQKSKNVSVTTASSHRRANIAVIIVASIAALLLITVAVLSGVKVDPMRDFDKPDYYNFYDLESKTHKPTDGEAQSKIKVAVGDMRFSVMSAVLQWNWDYSYNFKRNSSKEKIELSASDVAGISATASEYMLELVYSPVEIADGEIDYSTAHSIECDGEKVYFDRVKVLIGNTNGSVGTISLYPYIYARLDNQSDIDGIASDTYKVTGINVRANTTKAYAALKELASSLA